MKKITLLLLVTALMCITVEAQESWKTTTLDNFSIQHPNDWKADTSKTVGVDLILYAPQEIGDNFKENINVVVQDLSEYNLNLDSYTKLSEEQIKNMLEGGKITKSERITADSKTYHRIQYVGTQSGIALKFEQRYYVENDTAYVLTVTCLNSNFDAYIVLSRKIFDTFQMK
ncbi:hypothetical protein KORDIASMS9_01169 [Kordia sp. SMS9]|uniref:hypothetical protein n=1 Tax=Kordia sp. SMS9 TaxID=2282170 RepID=UPI000E0CF2C5|nr:hypothetical protein [Kordia sp. SMS9]AXG68950.1 hypothetical protein KORDIASMS9_01169 [Kordia sp. SMS9]